MGGNSVTESPTIFTTRGGGADESERLCGVGAVRAPATVACRTIWVSSFGAVYRQFPPIIGICFFQCLSCGAGLVGGHWSVFFPV